MTYKIFRFYRDGQSRVIRSGLTFEEAQAHCSDPETSSNTCTKPVNLARTRKVGAWFDGYELEGVWACLCDHRNGPSDTQCGNCHDYEKEVKHGRSGLRGR